MAFERISIDPARMRGLACIRGTRITVSALLGQLAAGQSIEQILADYPQLEREDVLAALEYAAAYTNEQQRHCRAQPPRRCCCFALQITSHPPSQQADLIVAALDTAGAELDTGAIASLTPERIWLRTLPISEA